MGRREEKEEVDPRWIFARIAIGRAFAEIGPCDASSADSTEAEVAALTRQLESDVRERSREAVAEMVRAPWIASAILEAARKLKADLIARGTHGRKGVSRLMLGSTAEYVVRQAECPVVTLHAPPLRSSTSF